MIATLNKMILSASGWRAVFACNAGNADGDCCEESLSPEISAEHRVIACAAGFVFGKYLQRKSCRSKPNAAAGMDTRPTGKTISEAVLRGLLVSGCQPFWLGVAAAPEIMAFTRASLTLDGFIYVSASHNPIGHNGLKFGLNDGGVLEASEVSVLIEEFRALVSDKARISILTAEFNAVKDDDLAKIYGQFAEQKNNSLISYMKFANLTAFGVEEWGVSKLCAATARGIAEKPIGIAADFNGSARTLSIDSGFLQEMGLKFAAINKNAGEIVHAIAPEGKALEPCRRFLKKLHQKDAAFAVGYTPDCDGDRGNLVVFDEAENTVRVLEAQEVFAICCAAELAHLVWLGFDQERIAVAVNDPTSLRVDAIAEYFGARVFRAEVGEANVVNLGRKLRAEGWTVRILGEGSNGGNITYPSAVRDPISTLMSIVKLLSVRTFDGKQGFFEIWCRKSGQMDKYRPIPTISDIMRTLPKFETTGTFSKFAVLRVKTADHSLLKRRYQVIFLKEWGKKRRRLAEFGIKNWEAAIYNGINEKLCVDDFGEAGRGGLKICFTGEDGKKIAAIWMRGSATEPVFRIMADTSAGKNAERYLIKWQRDMVMKADKGGGSAQPCARVGG
ncbi:phosphoglucomutase [Spirochaetia bacterium]|nr:phosphoglucomutase [Spirochaetia bacterium]